MKRLSSDWYWYYVINYTLVILILFPIYLKKGLFPKELASFNMFLSWIIILLCLGVNFINLSMYLRFLVCFISITVQLALIYDLAMKSKPNENFNI